ncbi:MAG TPA: ARMT1-like domain-containing protein [Tepidisphaeraceae bacterium]|jgi:type II pantothenate kinase|nr:ARMT1-like domain-containing protein [Tepidisphaeraceae bacterium]
MTPLPPQSEPRNPHSAIPLFPFVKLADPATYVACSWDLVADAEARVYWCEFFKRHVRTIMKLGIEAVESRGGHRDDAERRAAALLTEFDAFYDHVISQPTDYGRVTILQLDLWRDAMLRKHGFVDAFIDLKNRENEKMLPLLPAACAQLDALGGLEQVKAIIEGVFAGNIFDMGAEATAKAFVNGSPDFFAIRATLSPRPWLIDDFDALADRLLNGPRHRKAVFFIDNAGSDFLLGAIPMIRWLAMRGTRVVITANERPTLNDMTIHDVNAWWPRILATEPSLAALPIERVTSGTGEPLIDLLGVSAELNAAAADADLVILEGMGRGVESNLDAAFNCDAINLAMIKDLAVAKRHAGKVYDCVCRFR